MLAGTAMVGQANLVKEVKNTPVFCRMPPCPPALTRIKAQLLAELRIRMLEDGYQLEVGDCGPTLVIVNNQNPKRLMSEVKRDVDKAGENT